MFDNRCKYTNGERHEILIPFNIIPYLRVTKPRISMMVNFVAISSLLLAGGYGRFDILAFLIVSGVLSVAGASSFNSYLDRDLDAVMGRTQGRPIPSGRIIHANKVLFMGFVLSIVSVIVSWVFINSLTAFFIGLGIFTYVVVYTIGLKRRHPSNIVIGGFAGSCASLAGWSAVSSLTLVPIMIAVVVFLWTPSHFWCLALAIRDDYARAKLPMLPNLVSIRSTTFAILSNTLMLVASSFLLFILGGYGFIYLTIATLAGVTLVWANIRLVNNPSTKNAWQTYKFSSPYLGIILIALLLDSIII